jgi:hypothetical protein
MDDVSRLATASRMTASTLKVVGISPRDIVLAIRIALFVRRLPDDLARRDVTTFLKGLRRMNAAAGRGRGGDVHARARHLRRIAMAVLSLPRFWHWNTCYVRALIMYRFLAAADHDVVLHIGIEQRGAERALHGHAWLTLDDELLEAPGDVLLSSLREVPLDARR